MHRLFGFAVSFFGRFFFRPFLFSAVSFFGRFLFPRTHEYARISDIFAAYTPVNAIRTPQPEYPNYW